MHAQDHLRDLRVLAATGTASAGTQAEAAGAASSTEDSTAPHSPSTTAIASGRTRKPPRSA